MPWDASSSRLLNRQPQQSSRIFFEHDVQLTVGKPALVHLLHKSAYNGQAAILSWRIVISPKFRDETALRTNLADGVHATTGSQHFPEVELDNGSQLGCFQHLVHVHLSGQVHRM